MSPRHAIRKQALLLAAAGILLVALGLYFRWWDRYVEEGLARWAVGEIARRTDDAYHLVLGDLSFRPLSGSLSFDSATVVTDSAKNLSRLTPLPTLNGRAQQCRLSGVNVARLFFRESFDARLLGCDRVVAGIVLIPRVVRDSKAPEDTLGSNAPVRSLPRPLGLSLFRITEISFPVLSFTIRRPGADGGASALLDRARFHVADLVFDPTVDSRAHRSVAVRSALIGAKGLVLRPDTLSEMAIARLEAGITDSTLGLAGAKSEPSMTDREWVRNQKFRRDRVRFGLDSLEARGVAYRSFVGTGDIDIRAIEVRGVRLNVLSDKRLPKGRSKEHPTPQQAAARVGLPFRVDTVLVSGGDIVYLERKPEKERAGRISFDSVHGRILNLDLPSRGKPLRIEARARLMNAGLLSVHAIVPLDAADFRYVLDGKLAPMSATTINDFLAENESIKLEKGWVDGIEFSQVATRGRATTTLTPRYRELTVESSSEGGGVIGSVKRAFVKFAANTFKVREENPEDDGKKLRTAKTVRVYDPTKSWISFLWLGLRDGLTEVIVK
jgi:hypothetical protein